MDIEKAFDSLDHTFVISVLKNIGFGETLISNKNLVSSMVVILPNTFILKAGLTKVAIFWPIFFLG